MGYFNIQQISINKGTDQTAQMCKCFFFLKSNKILIEVIVYWGIFYIHVGNPTTKDKFYDWPY